ncbi:MAG: hypothetical protein HKN09_11770 [Saprospiraceae bacterium]|nr:hypothetical protein [Saprospiraceae bacterium]
MGWIHGVSPRGITEWFSINEAVGILNNGKDCLGDPSHYHDVAQSKGIAVVNYNVELLSGFKLQLADYWIHHLMNTVWLQADYSIRSFLLGFQWVSQQSSNFQNGLEINQRYFDPQFASNTVAFRLGWSRDNFQMNINYLQGLDEGRFLFPKELGRDDFYTSLPRMWMDGLGKSQVASLNFSWQSDPLKVKTSVAYLSTPDRENFISNKYGLNDFVQCNLQVDYTFNDVLEGLQLTFLYVTRPIYDNEGLSTSDKFYKYDLHHFNFITNINF